MNTVASQIPRLDLFVPSGTTIAVEVQYETQGTSATPETLVAGDRVLYKGAPWTVYSCAPASPTRWRLRLGSGFWWEPDLLLAPDELVPRAVARTWLTSEVWYRDPYGQRQPIPTELSADALTLVLVPHTDEAHQWSRDLGHVIDGTTPAPAPPVGVAEQTWRMAFDYDINGTFVDLPGTYQVVQGTLIVQPSVAEPGPVVTP